MCCGFVGDIVGGVVDAIGSVAEYVIDNALPIVETIALSYALGPSGFALVGDVASKAIANATVTALNGGSLGNIAAAGLTPYINTPGFIKDITGVDLPSPTGFVNETVSKVITDPDIAKLVSGAVGSATTAGLIAGVTGGDILKAAEFAGMQSIVSAGIAKTWDAVKSNLPKLTSAEQQYTDQYNQVKDVLPKVQQAQAMQADLVNQENLINSKLYDYNSVKSTYDQTYDLYQQCVADNNISLGNGYANQLNNVLGPQLTSMGNEINSIYDSYQSGTQTFQDFLKTNQADFEMASPIINNLNNIQSQYDLLTNQIQGDYTQFKLADAIANKDWSAAADYYKTFTDINNTIAQTNPNATVAPIFNQSQTNLFDQLAGATDEATKATLLNQANLMDFSNLAQPTTPTTLPESTLPTPPTTPTTPSTNPYDNLPKLPETGIPTDTPTTPTTPTDTTTTPTTPVTPTTPTTPTTAPTGGSNAVNVIGNNLVNAFGNAIKGGIVSNLTNQVLNTITGQPTSPTKQAPSVRVPPKHVDVSTLKPYSGNLSQFKPPAGTTGQTTNTGQTTTQTGNSGLTSTTTNKPPQKVDVSTLKPVTDMNWLKSLGIVQG